MVLTMCSTSASLGELNVLFVQLPYSMSCWWVMSVWCRLHFKEVIHRGKIELWPKNMDLSYEKCVIDGYRSALFPRYHVGQFLNQFSGFLQEFSILATGRQLEEICGECHGLREPPAYFHYERFTWSNDEQKVSISKVANVHFPLKVSVAEDGKGLLQVRTPHHFCTALVLFAWCLKQFEDIKYKNLQQCYVHFSVPYLSYLHTLWLQNLLAYSLWIPSIWMPAPKDSGCKFDAQNLCNSDW